jgi:hypothetical protein
LRAAQISDKLRDEPWYVVQSHALHLRPWEMPPSSEGELLRRNLDSGSCHAANLFRSKDPILRGRAAGKPFSSRGSAVAGRLLPGRR